MVEDHCAGTRSKKIEDIGLSFERGLPVRAANVSAPEKNLGKDDVQGPTILRSASMWLALRRHRYSGHLMHTGMPILGVFTENFTSSDHEVYFGPCPICRERY